MLNELFPPVRFPDGGPAGTDPYRTPDELLTSLGYNPANTSTTGNTPSAIGNLAGKAVMDYRRGDGSNQANNYADTTGYTPKNTWHTITDPWHWQPLCVPNASPPPGSELCPGGAVQKAATPQWGTIPMFGGQQASRLRVNGPPKNADGSYSTADIPVAIADAANLTDAEKATAEYWADGPKSEFPPGHTAIFAQAISRKNSHTLDTDAKMFMLVGNAMMDAGIAAWYQKYKYDSARNITLIRYFYKDQLVNSWLGPNQGFGDVPGQQWRPYQATNVVTPPFPEYVSGHSTFTSAGSRILGMFNGDPFGATVLIPAGSSKFESNTPASDVTLSFPTFTQAADQAGLSRRYGGIHLQTGDIHGRALGVQVAGFVWSMGQNYINGYIGK